MFYLLYGEDEYTRSQALAEMKAKVGDPATSDLNTTLLEGQGLTLEELVQACDASPFLSQRRLIIVYDFASQFEPKDRRRKGKGGLPPQKQKLIDGLRGYLPHLPESTRLVFVEGRLGRANPLLKLVSEAEGGFVKEFQPPKGERLRRWVSQRVEERGGVIRPEAVEELTDFLGGDLRLLDQEIEKLVIYTQGRPIEKEDVELLVSEAQVGNIFSLVDALGQRDPKEALSHLHRLIEAGQPTPYILFMITRQFRLLLQVKELQVQGLGWRAVQSRLRTPSFVAQKLSQQARNFSRTGLEDIHKRLLDLDMAIKTGQMEPQLALDLLVVELSNP